jgi:hypothetical protein
VVGLLSKVYPPAQKWKAGVVVPIDPAAQSTMDVIYEELLSVVGADEDKDVTAAALEAIAYCLRVRSQTLALVLVSSVCVV